MKEKNNFYKIFFGDGDEKRKKYNNLLVLHS